MGTETATLTHNNRVLKCDYRHLFLIEECGVHVSSAEDEAPFYRRTNGATWHLGIIIDKITGKENIIYILSQWWPSAAGSEKYSSARLNHHRFNYCTPYHHTLSNISQDHSPLEVHSRRHKVESRSIGPHSLLPSLFYSWVG